MRKTKAEYESADIGIILLESSDIIATSGGSSDGVLDDNWDYS